MPSSAISAPKTAAEVNQKLGLSTNPQIVRNRLQAKILNTLLNRKKPFISKRNQRGRLKWARSHSAWTINHWKLVQWTDENWFKILSKPENCGRVLFSTKLGPQASAKIVTRWFQNKQVKIRPWAAQPRDLSPNEHLRSELEHKISNRSSSTKDCLKSIHADEFKLLLKLYVGLKPCTTCLSLALQLDSLSPIWVAGVPGQVKCVPGFSPCEPRPLTPPTCVPGDTPCHTRPSNDKLSHQAKTDLAGLCAREDLRQEDSPRGHVARAREGAKVVRGPWTPRPTTFTHHASAFATPSSFGYHHLLSGSAYHPYHSFVLSGVQVVRAEWTSGPHSQR
ncbi:Transposable element Tc1 transposase [Folsomia candida]|uniref:Transposable element Tc1 transposase n=1 Tax=Folsomia candida TaxID=158441 RepID=A0A226DK61_FOLCA|nr:Transposable element Tc1 transposase [Folsomia candida]